MKQPRKPNPFLIVALVLSAGFAQTAASETLEQAMAAALEDNPALAAGRDQLHATAEDIAIARSGYFPRVVLQGSASRGTSPNTQLVTPAVSNLGLTQQSTGYSATLEQPLFDGLRTLDAVGEAEESTEATRDEVRATRQRLLLDAVKAYMAVLRDRATVGQLKASAEMLAEDLALTGKLAHQGQATATDIDQTTARLETARAALTEAGAALSASESGFAEAIGHAPASLTQPAAPSGLPGSLSEAEAAMRIHPELSAARHRAAAAQRAVDKVAADFSPQVSLDASYTRTYSAPAEVTDGGDAQVSVQVTLPISLGGETLAKLRQAKFALRQRLDELAAKRRELVAEVASAWSGLAGLRGQAVLGHKAAAASEKALRGIKMQRKAGEKTALDVLNAEADLVQARLTEIRARSDLVVSAYALLAAMGKLAPDAEP